MDEHTQDNAHVKRCVEQIAGPAQAGQAALLEAMLQQDFLPAILRQIVEGQALVEVLYCDHGDEDDASAEYWFDPTPGHHLSTLLDLLADVRDWLRDESAACHFYAVLGQDSAWRCYLGSVVKREAVDVDEPVAALLGWTGLTVEQRQALLDSPAAEQAQVSGPRNAGQEALHA
jgi:hypothetical protein